MNNSKCRCTSGNCAPLALARLDTGIRYSGTTAESLSDWLQVVNQKGVVENWGDAEKRRAAIASLYGPALTWQEEVGVNFVDWNDWVLGIRHAFEIQLTESQWQVMVETRRQQAAESGSSYVLEKIKICRRRPNPMTELEMIPFLIRGLSNPAHMSVMMGHPPVTIADFLVELRRLEAFSTMSVGPALPQAVPQTPAFSLPPTAASMDSVCKAIELLTQQVSVLTHGMARLPAPVPALPGMLQPPTTTFGTFRRPPGAGNQVQCYNGQGFGHLSRNCPHPNPRYPKNGASENFQAAHRGRVGPKCNASPL